MDNSKSNQNFLDFIDSSFCNNRTFKVGKFNILLPEVFGFCGGVISALKKLENTVNQCTGIDIYLLGEIIHNPTVNEYFAYKGVKIIPEHNLNSVFTTASLSDIIVIPAFGIPLDIEYDLRKHFHNIVDTTCKNVKSVWDFISEKSINKSTIILHGKPGHPEVKASISRAVKNSSVIILPNINAAEKFAEFIINNHKKEGFSFDELTIYGIQCLNKSMFNIKNFALANQTTMLYNETKKIESILVGAAKEIEANLSSCNTICRATFLRQKAAGELCKLKPDLVFIVGGYDSSNTNHLYHLASENIKTLYIKNYMAFSKNKIISYNLLDKTEEKIKTPEILKNCKNIGILAGASCPFSVIKKLIDKIAKI